MDSTSSPTEERGGRKRWNGGILVLSLKGELEGKKSLFLISPLLPLLLEEMARGEEGGKEGLGELDLSEGQTEESEAIASLLLKPKRSVYFHKNQLLIFINHNATIKV